jgi:hypothetical protein
MANDKKPSGNLGGEKNAASHPSIYSDRGTIGSADELDEYGVWVKSEPQDLSSAGQENSHQETADSDDFALDLPGEDLSLSEDDFAMDIEAAAEEEPLSFDPQAEEDSLSFDLPAEEEPLSLDLPAEEDSLSFDLPAEEDPLSLELPAEEESLSLDLPAEDSGDDIDFPDLEIPAEETEEISVEVPSVEEDLSGPELMEFGTLAGSEDEAGPSDEPEALPDDSPADESAFAFEEEGSEIEEEFSEVPVTDFLGDSPETLEESPADLDTGLSAETETEEKPRTGHTEAEMDLSTRLLMKIAEELSSIRTELSSLKKEFTVLKSGVPAGEEQGGFFDEEEDEKIALTGDELDNILNTADFTEESGEDATEALDTGDPAGGPVETAGEEDFSLSEGEDILNENPEDEEAGMENAGPGASDINPDAGSGGSFDGDIDLDLADSDLDELSGESRIEAKSEPFSFDEEDEPLTINDLEEKDAEELKHLREEGALPITAAPEDTTYLEEDPLGTTEITEEIQDSGETEEISLDLSDAVIDEPDFSGEITENPVEEPSLDSISIDVDSGDLSVEESGEEIVIDESVSGGEGDLDNEEIAIDESALSDEDILGGESLVEESIAAESVDEESFAEDSFEDITIDEDEDLAGAGESGEDLSGNIPEGFIVAAEESPSYASPDTETEDVSAGDFDDGEAARDEFTVESGGDEIVFEEGPEPDEELSFGEEAESEMEAEDAETGEKVPGGIKEELKTVLSYMDQLLESLPEEKIEEFARSEYFDTYKKLFKELGLV